MRYIYCLLIVFLLIPPCNGQNLQTVIDKINAGTFVNIWLIGDSVGEGFSGDWTHPVSSPGIDDLLRSKLANLTGYTKLLLTPTNNRTGDLSPVNSWAMQIRTFLKNKNAASTFDNESASGWTSADHLNGHEGMQGTPQPGTEDTLAMALLAMPDAVVIELGINDWNNPGLVTLSQYQNNISLMTNSLCAAGIAVVLAKSNSIDPTGLGHTDDPNLAGFYPYMETAATNANAAYPGCVGILDFYGPTSNKITANGGYSADRALGPSAYPFAALTNNCMFDQFHPDQICQNLMGAAAIAFLQQTTSSTAPKIQAARAGGKPLVRLGGVQTEQKGIGN